MTLYVIRHGIAEDAGPGTPDEARRLTPVGRTRMRGVARGMRALGVGIDVLLTSPLVRARETAEIVAEVYGNIALREVPALASGVAPAETVRALRPFARRARVAIVGHEPGLSGIASLLLTGSTEGVRIALKKGAVIALEVETLGPRSDATLRWLLTAKQLRRIGK